jgi:hypothetical protein
MQSTASLQLTLHEMRLCDKKLSEILILVRLQYGLEAADGYPILCPG